MRRLVAILASLGLLFVAGVAPAAAVGNCSTAEAAFVNSSGSTARYFCYGVNDNDIEGEAISTVMGPLSDGAYLNDFDPREDQSGVYSVEYFEGSGAPSGLRICLYQGKNYTGGISSRSTAGIIHFTTFTTPGSFKFTTSPC